MCSLDPSILDSLREKLGEIGLDVRHLGSLSGEGEGQVKVVCLAASMRDTLAALSAHPRDQVLMVRVDSDTLASLDAWVETGAVKSRSEAAALFIREGLQVRSAELESLKDALHGVDEARRTLQQRAQEVLGTNPDDD